MAMATPAAATGRPTSHRTIAEPLLEPGDRLSREEFERRYERMPWLNKAELIEGIVYMPSPLRAEKHGEPHNRLGTCLGTYSSETPASGALIIPLSVSISTTSPSRMPFS